MIWIIAAIFASFFFGMFVMALCCMARMSDQEMEIYEKEEDKDGENY